MDGLPQSGDAMQTKRCSICGMDKPVACFRLKLVSCKACNYKITRQWILGHPLERKQYSDRYYKNNSKECKERSVLWRKNNPEKVTLIQKRCREKRSLNPKCSLDKRMSSAVRNVLRSNKRGRSWQNLTGYTTEDFRQHLESLFTKGMTWDLFVQGKIHVDHIIPVTRFNYQTAEDPEFKICWGMANLQPLWAHDNQSKYNKTMSEWKGIK
jgi:hypothetical protein